jgi:hypothetical protein
MDDRLEKFIRSHRQEMDNKGPRRDLWQDIEKEVITNARQRQLSRTVIFWRAAAVILLLISSWLVIDKVNRDIPGNEATEIAELNPQLMEAENYYVALINEKKQEIRSMSEKYDLGDDFLYEIDVLDSMYSTLKEDLPRGDEENLVDAMILNLQLRIEILNEQLSIIQSIENNQRNENISL